MEKTMNPAEMTLGEFKEKFGVDLTIGTVSSAGGKYYFKVGKKKTELDPKRLIASEPLGKIFGKVERYAGGIIIDYRPAVVFLMQKDKVIFKRRILCYLPMPDHLRRVDRAMRTELIDALVERQALPDILGQEILRGFDSPL